MQKWRTQYMTWLKQRPFLTNAVTGGCITCVADLIAQHITKHGDDSGFDWRRNMTMISWSCFSSGFPAVLWYRWLDATFGTERKFLTVAKKIALNQLLFAVSINAAFLWFVPTVEQHVFGKRNVESITYVQRLQQDLLDTWINSCKIWPAAHVFNFYFVASEHRVIYMNIVNLIWMCYLSWKAHEAHTKSQQATSTKS